MVGGTKRLSNKPHTRLLLLLLIAVFLLLLALLLLLFRFRTPTLNRKKQTVSKHNQDQMKSGILLRLPPTNT